MVVVCTCVSNNAAATHPSSFQLPSAPRRERERENDERLRERDRMNERTNESVAPVLITH